MWRGPFFTIRVKQKRSAGANKRQLCGVDAEALGGTPLKSIAFKRGSKTARLWSDGCELIGVLVAGHLFPVISRPDDTDYKTSELSSVARRRAVEPIGTKFYGEGNWNFPLFLGLPCNTGWVPNAQIFFQSILQELFQKSVSLKALLNNLIPISSVLERRRKRFNLPGWLVWHFFCHFRNVRRCAVKN